MDKCTIYVESFPETYTNVEIAQIFSRSWIIRHITLPKFKNSDRNKGFAFIEFSTPEETIKAVKMFNGTIP